MQPTDAEIEDATALLYGPYPLRAQLFAEAIEAQLGSYQGSTIGNQLTILEALEAWLGVSPDALIAAVKQKREDW